MKKTQDDDERLSAPLSVDEGDNLLDSLEPNLMPQTKKSNPVNFSFNPYTPINNSFSTHQYSK